LFVRIFGVIDLKAGRAVHAQGGAREDYAPVRSTVLGAAEPGDAVALAHAYRTHGSVGGIYVADLDAIDGAEPSDLAGIAAVGLPLVVDAGANTPDRARAAAARAAGHGSIAARVVVGLETLGSFGDLAAIATAIGSDRTVFSLDMRDGVPLGPPGTDHARWTPVDLACRAAAYGVRSVILLDLFRVGRSLGVDLSLVGEIRRALPPHELELIVGGGIRGDDDIRQLDAMGCDGALIATAILGTPEYGPGVR
jgi:phosphoribosylformimino-5-aminoimidazole carboxamide ribotide isomerase